MSAYPYKPPRHSLWYGMSVNPIIKGVAFILPHTFRSDHQATYSRIILSSVGRDTFNTFANSVLFISRRT